MKDFYIKMMLECHQKGEYSERNNYAKAAGLGLLEMFELCGN